VQTAPNCNSTSWAAALLLESSISRRYDVIMSLIWRFLNWTFSNKFVDDNDFREPISLQLNDGWKIQILLPSVPFMLQVIWIVFLQMVVGCVLSTILYYWVMVPVKDRSDQMTTTSPTQKCTTQGFLVGLGVVIPLTLLIPYMIINEFDIRNLGFRLAWVSLPMTMILRTFQAMLAFVPPEQSQSWWAYTRHTGFVLQPRYSTEGKTSTVTLFSVVRILSQYLYWLFWMALAYHFFLSTNFCPLTRMVNSDDVDTTRIVHWDLPHLYDTFLQACMMNFSLSLSMTGISALGSILTGVQMDDDVTRHPMFLSESVSDFWGRRWNNLIHVALKQGIYKPVRTATQSKSLASLAAFVVSGFCHEFVWLILFFPTDRQLAEGSQYGSSCCLSCYCLSWMGKQLVFFGWNGLLITMEYFVGDALASHTKHFPPLVRSHLVVLLALPVGHLFTFDITKAGYFAHLRAAMPLISIKRITNRRLTGSQGKFLNTILGLLALTTASAVEEHHLYDNRQLLGLRGGMEGIAVSPRGQGMPSSGIPIANVSIPLHFHSGSHHTHMYIGSPPQRQTLIVDTGSKAMSFPCQTCKKCAPCCGSHASPYFDPELSTTHRVTKCGSCLLEGISSCSLFGDQCTFSQKYTEGSSWTAMEVEDMVWMGTPDVVESLEYHMGMLAIPYPFGCQTSNKGLFRKQYGDGILGLSIHDSSLIRALYLERLIPRNAFSLCFTHESGYLSLGGTLPAHTHHTDTMTMTPITREHGYYSVEVVSLSIGDTLVISADINGDLLEDMNSGKGCIFDSGTTDSFFPSSIRKVVSAVVMEQTRMLTDFSPAMRRHVYTYSAFQRLPTLTIGFTNNASLTILPDHYMEGVPIDPSTGRAEAWDKSIALTNRIYLDEATGTVLGANAMYGHDILFDVQGHQIGIAPANCHSSIISSQL
jgi:hypothetical protein